VQRAAHTLPGFTSLLGVAYLTLHLAVTAVVLLWRHGNHFFLDAAAGALVAGLAATASAVITRPAASARVTALPPQRKPLPPLEELAA